MRFLLTCVIALLTVGSFQAQNKYLVSLTDKKGVSFEPLEYFSVHTINKRNSLGIPLNQISDRPLNKNYINSIRNIVESVQFESRWLNAIVVYAFEDQVELLHHFSFVERIELLPSSEFHLAEFPGLKDNYLEEDQKTYLKEQLGRMEGEKFTANGIDGSGVRIAVFDIGFKNAHTNPAFEHLRKNKKILRTWDFVDNDNDVYHYNSHGTMVLSCIGGMIDSIPIGLATGAEFLLARTEKNSEKFSEEEYWLAAAEWADKNGADIINSSLGYTHHRYFNDQMDGKTSLVARAASMAAKKGILVVNAAGNSGMDDWYYIGTPADADSVLSIGGISPQSDFHISFSSFGPTSDKRMKPNLCAYGTALTAKNDFLSYADGTSFASPLVAGFAACAWQSNPDWSNMDLFRQLEMSGDLYPYFDYAHGYGVPQAGFFTDQEKSECSPTFSFVEDGKWLKIVLPADFNFEEEKKENLVFYNFQRTDHVLEEYAVVKAYDQTVLRFKLDELKKGTRINVSFLGYYNSYLID